MDRQLAQDTHSTFFDGMMEIDYNLVDEGFVLTNEYLTMLLDGTFHCVNDRSFIGSHRSTK